MKLLRVIRELILYAVYTLVAIELVYFLWIVFRMMRCH